MCRLWSHARALAVRRAAHSARHPGGSRWHADPVRSDAGGSHCRSRALGPALLAHRLARVIRHRREWASAPGPAGYFSDPSVWLVAEHGAWHRGKGGWQPTIDLDAKPVQDLADRLEAIAESYAGRGRRAKDVVLRGPLSADAHDARAAFGVEVSVAIHQFLAGHPTYGRVDGNQVIEIRAAGARKSMAVSWAKTQLPDARIIAIGDDLTDEHLFGALEALDEPVLVRGGIPRRTRARWDVEGVDGARQLLAFVRDTRKTRRQVRFPSPPSSLRRGPPRRPSRSSSSPIASPTCDRRSRWIRCGAATSAASSPRSSPRSPRGTACGLAGAGASSRTPTNRATASTRGRRRSRGSTTSRPGTAATTTASATARCGRYSTRFRAASPSTRLPGNRTSRCTPIRRTPPFAMPSGRHDLGARLPPVALRPRPPRQRGIAGRWACSSTSRSPLRHPRCSRGRARSSRPCSTSICSASTRRSTSRTSSPASAGSRERDGSPTSSSIAAASPRVGAIPIGIIPGELSGEAGAGPRSRRSRG